MRVLQSGSDRATVELTMDDLLTFNNALNEVCNALDLAEFATRMGVELSEARALLRQVRDVLTSMDTAP